MVYRDHAQGRIPLYIHERSWPLERRGDVLSAWYRVLGTRISGTSSEDRFEEQLRGNLLHEDSC